MDSKIQTIEGDTTVHVAQFLQEPVGATRQRRIVLESLPLDDDGGLTARGVEADVKLTRIPAGILADGRLSATVRIECIRCLEEFDQPVQTAFADEYRPTVDILSGLDVSPEEADEGETDYFPITGTHVLDLKESLRQAILLGLPMAPLCREDCPGVAGAAERGGEEVDNRLAVLRDLLGAEDEDDSTATADGYEAKRRRTGS